MSESNAIATSALKLGAVALSLALMGGYVWHRSSGSPAAAESNSAAREILPGSKSAAIELPSPARHGNTVDEADPSNTVSDVSYESTIPGNSKVRNGRVVIELTPEQQEVLGKVLVNGPNTGADLKPEEINALLQLQETSMKLAKNPNAPIGTETVAPPAASEQSAPAQKHRRVLLSGSKSDVLVPSSQPDAVIEPPTVILKPNPAPPPPPAQPLQPHRRVLMPSSKSMVLPEDRVYIVPAPRQQAQQQGRGF